ncbi:MAG: aspartate aminotransferase family protein, partial [Deltaproteobacteria bacterium]|nr:aspartate aminotransferase family protein [Deltaproteobacteria bacterium]
MSNTIEELMKGLYPYADEYGVIRGFPETGRSTDSILEELRTIARKEDQSWENGRCSGTMYSGDHEHYDFLNSVFSLFSYVNSLQRDICPSMTRFESDIIAMAVDMLHGSEVTKHDPRHMACGAVGFGGTESIINPLLVYRDKARAERNIDRPNIIVPETAHAAFRKGAHLLGIDVTKAPVDPTTTLVDVDFVRDHIDRRTIALVGSAGNYPYGTIDPIEQLSELAVHHGIGLHVDGCLGGFILPWGEALGYDIPVFDFRLPGVTSISADTHKFGYGLKGTSVVLYRDASLRRHQYHIEPTWQGGIYASNGLAGSRSGGLIAATWAAMVRYGREGYLRYAKQIFETSFRMQASVKSHASLVLMGDPTFCFSFRSDEFNIYHVNDFMKTRGWRFNGQQHPPAIHMCVTRPQTRDGIADAFAADLADAVS